MQTRLEWLPTANAEENHRRSQRTAILAALRVGHLTATELFALGGPGFSSRLTELKREGHPIKMERVGRIGVYSLGGDL
jgi:hypothetical protein